MSRSQQGRKLMEQLGQEDQSGNQRLIWVMLILGAVFVAWSMFMGTKKGPPTPPQKAQNIATSRKQAAPTAGSGVKAAASPVAAAVTAPTQPESVVGTAAETVKLENDVLKIEISNRGAVLLHVRLKKYTNEGVVDDLVSPLSKDFGRYPLALKTGDDAYDSKVSSALFHVEQSADSKGDHTVKMTWSNGKGDAVTKVLTLPAKGYLLDMEASAYKGGKRMDSVPLQWGPGFAKLLPSEAKNRYYQKGYVGLVEGNSFHKVKRSKVKEGNPHVVDTYADKGPIKWAAITDNYFAAIFIPDGTIKRVQVVTDLLSEKQQKLLPFKSTVTLITTFPGRGKLYLGPKEYEQLARLAPKMKKLTDWGILGPLCAILLWGLNKLYLFTGNYGVAILLLTLIIKLTFYPLTQSSMVKMKSMGEGMKKLKPQIDRIKAKYKKAGKGMESRNKMNEEMMALYKKEGVNPLGSLGGCLPMLIQMPIFFALFELLPRAIELRGAEFFGWIHDLSIPDPYYITPIVMGLSMVFSTKMTATQSMEGAQKMMTWFMPIFFTWICLWAPAGLNVYWLTNNVLTIGQQALINKKTAKLNIAAAKTKKSTPKRPSRPSHG